MLPVRRKGVRIKVCRAKKNKNKSVWEMGWIGDVEKVLEMNFLYGR